MRLLLHKLLSRLETATRRWWFATTRDRSRDGHSTYLIKKRGFTCIGGSRTLSIANGFESFPRSSDGQIQAPIVRLPGFPSDATATTTTTTCCAITRGTPRISHSHYRDGNNTSSTNNLTTNGGFHHLNHLPAVLTYTCTAPLYSVTFFTCLMSQVSYITPLWNSHAQKGEPPSPRPDHRLTHIIQ
jgi:hypothetical protein